MRYCTLLSVFKNCTFNVVSLFLRGFPSSAVKNLPASAKEVGLIPGSGRSRGGANGNALQCSCPQNPMDRGAWQATVRGVTMSWKGPRTHRCTYFFFPEKALLFLIALLKTDNP